MFRDIDELLYKLRFFIFGILVVACFALLAVLSSVIGNNSAHALNADASSSTNVVDASMEYDPNEVTAGLFRAVNATGRTMNSLNRATNSMLFSTAKVGTATIHGGTMVGTATIHSGTFVASGAQTGLAVVGQAAGTGALFATRAIVSYVVFTSSIPVRTVSSIVHAPLVDTVVSPNDGTPIPQIGRSNATFAAAITPTATASAAAAAAPAAPAPAVVPQWPIHGAITTMFGVPEPPYQPIHTGLDISDGARRGTTPVRPYLPGKVIQVIHSRLKLGNEVVVDHGNGLTSVYGHLNSTSVQEGQEVNQSTTLGYEGTTGVSTGVHLHFEIRVNGVAKNPLNFITGRP
jgi:hypothetical protein